MKFSSDQEVTPYRQDLQTLRFGKIYQIRAYDHEFICGCGAPMVQLKEFNKSFIFCERCLDPVATLDRIQADLNSLGNVQIEHIKKKP